MSSVSRPVIIPHPNEMKKISDFQNQLLQTWRGLLIPVYPLFIEIPEEVKNENAFSCLIEGLFFEDDKIGCTVSLKTDKKALTGSLILARIRKDKIFNDNPDFKNKDLFPLKLPVFKLALVEFTESENLLEWKIVSEKWIKSA